MGKPKPVADAAEQTYPTLAEFTSSRRGFLKRLAVSVLGVGVGSQLLSGCQFFPHTSGTGPDPNYHDVRLPAQGTASLYMDMGDYLSYAVTLITYDEAVADFYQANEAAGLQVIQSTIQSLYCGDVTDPDSRSAVEEALRQALEERAAGELGRSAKGIASCTLLVDSCEEGNIAGGMADPDYP